MKAFIEVEVVKDFPEINETKVSTASGTEIYLPSSEVIPTDPLSGGGAHEDLDLASFGGSVVINGRFLTASEVKLYLGLYEGLLRQYEDLKDAYKNAERRNLKDFADAVSLDLERNAKTYSLGDTDCVLAIPQDVALAIVRKAYRKAVEK